MTKEAANPKRPPGRPRQAIKASERVEIRCYATQKEAWHQAAKKAGFKTLAAWLKSLADEHAQAE
ncbi:hypothetical protein [Thiolapillus sp.]|uniref:hypothetical protein n=1 Tax=Thiolapillus sp. TaxID=2017437 RepID=UPI0025EB66C9|nr:hypothetical protein [Thiolapillus sp.]